MIFDVSGVILTLTLTWLPPTRTLSSLRSFPATSYRPFRWSSNTYWLGWREGWLGASRLRIRKGALIPMQMIAFICRTSSTRSLESCSTTVRRRWRISLVGHKTIKQTVIQLIYQPISTHQSMNQPINQEQSINHSINESTNQVGQHSRSFECQCISIATCRLLMLIHPIFITPPLAHHWSYLNKILIFSSTLWGEEKVPIQLLSPFSRILLPPLLTDQWSVLTPILVPVGSHQLLWPFPPLPLSHLPL